MPYIKPTPTDFLARYPEFTGEEESRIGALIDEAELHVQDHWIEKYRVPAILALTAHFLYTEMESANSVESNYAGEEVAGPIVSKSVGPLTIRYKGYSKSSSGGTSSRSSSGGVPGDPESNPYGRRYLDLLRLSFPAAVAIG